MQVRLYDTTLRDGTQREGISLSVDDKSTALKYPHPWRLFTNSATAVSTRQRPSIVTSGPFCDMLTSHIPSGSVRLI